MPDRIRFCMVLFSNDYWISWGWSDGWLRQHRWRWDGEQRNRCTRRIVSLDRTSHFAVCDGRAPRRRDSHRSFQMREPFSMLIESTWWSKRPFTKVTPESMRILQMTEKKGTLVGHLDLWSMKMDVLACASPTVGGGITSCENNRRVRNINRNRRVQCLRCHLCWTADRSWLWLSLKQKMVHLRREFSSESSDCFFVCFYS